MRTGRNPQFRRGNALRTFLLGGLLGAMALFFARGAWGAGESLEYQVKAVFLLNFTRFIDWPPASFAEPASPVTICILGEDPFGRALDQVVNGEAVNGRKVIVQRIKRMPSGNACQVLFVSEPDKETVKALPALGPGVLTVGEGENFLRGGGMISFVIENRRVRFDINQSAAQAAALKLSSKLLSVARSVH